jgi:anti-sigma factor RsiW
MTHERYQDLVSDYLDRSLSPGDLRDFETHLAGCAECSRLTEKVRQALRDLQSYPRIEVSAGFAARVLEKTTRRDRVPGAWDVLWSYVALPRLSPAAAAALLAIPLILMAGTRDGRQLTREVSMAAHQTYSNAIRLYSRRSDLGETAVTVGRKLPGQIEETVDWIRRQIGSGEAGKAPAPESREPKQQSFRSLDRGLNA